MAILSKLFGTNQKKETEKKIAKTTVNVEKKDLIFSSKDIWESKPEPLILLLPMMVEIPEIYWTNAETLLKDNNVQIKELKQDAITYSLNGDDYMTLPLSELELPVCCFNSEQNMLQWDMPDIQIYIHVALRIVLLKKIGIYEKIIAERRKSQKVQTFTVDLRLLQLVPEEDFQQAWSMAHNTYVFKYKAKFFLDFLPDEAIGLSGYVCGQNAESKNPISNRRCFRIGNSLQSENLINAPYMPLNCRKNICTKFAYCPISLAGILRTAINANQIEEIKYYRSEARKLTNNNICEIGKKLPQPSVEILKNAIKDANEIRAFEYAANAENIILYSTTQTDPCNQFTNNGISSKYCKIDDIKEICESCPMANSLKYKDYSGCPEQLILYVKYLSLTKQLESYINSIKKKNIKSAMTAPSEDKFSLKEATAHLIGLSNIKTALADFEAFTLFKRNAELRGITIPNANMHMLFLGNPGTGKTTIARMMARFLYKCGIISEEKVIEVSRKDLVADYVGQTAHKTDAKIQEAIGGILFIDEAYTLYSESPSDFGYEAVTTIMKAMEDFKDRLIIIFAGYESDMQKFLSMNNGIYSRIGYTFIFDDYSAEELTEMYVKKLNENGFKVDKQCYRKLNALFNFYKQQPNFGNGRFVDKTIDQTLRLKAKRNNGTFDLISIDDIPNQIL